MIDVANCWLSRQVLRDGLGCEATPLFNLRLPIEANNVPEIVLLLGQPQTHLSFHSAGFVSRSKKPTF